MFHDSCINNHHKCNLIHKCNIAGITNVNSCSCNYVPRGTRCRGTAGGGKTHPDRRAAVAGRGAGWRAEGCGCWAGAKPLPSCRAGRGARSAQSGGRAPLFASPVARKPAPLPATGRGAACRPPTTRREGGGLPPPAVR